MPATISATLEDRVAQLEKITARLVAGAGTPQAGDWRSVIGMFGDDELMKQVDEEGRRWREEENRRSLS